MSGVLLGVMLLAGALGGLVSYFLSDVSTPPTSSDPQTGKPRELKFLVPLFLNTISSSLITEVLKATSAAGAVPNLLIIVGFCLVAAMTSRNFIQSLSTSVLRQLSDTKKEAQQAKKTADETEAVVDAQTEPEELPPALPGAALMAAKATDISDAERALLHAMISTPYISRSFSGLTRETKLSKEEVNAALSSLTTKSLIAQRFSKTRNAPQWYATPDGRRAIASS
jgi:hypothetical protein